MADLPQAYVELRDRVRIHLKQIRKSDKKHPEYAVALLVAVASEALSRLRGRERWYVFAKLLARHGVSKMVARDIFRVVRHGLAHRYETACVVMGRQRVVMVIAWRMPAMHVKIRDRLVDGVRRPCLFLDMDTMWWDLDAYFKTMNRELRLDGNLARRVVGRGRYLDDRYSVKPEDASLAEWQGFLSELQH